MEQGTVVVVRSLHLNSKVNESKASKYGGVSAQELPIETNLFFSGDSMKFALVAICKFKR